MEYQSNFMQNNMSSAKGVATANPYAAAVTGGVSVVADAIATSKQNHAARRAAKHQRDWQQGMSSTAHRREVNDLKQAGLNPILSATGGSGASTGSSGLPPVGKINPTAATQGGLAAYTARANATIARNAEKRSNDTQKVWDSPQGQEVLPAFNAATSTGANNKTATLFSGVNSARKHWSKIKSTFPKNRLTPHDQKKIEEKFTGKLNLYPGNQIK